MVSKEKPNQSEANAAHSDQSSVEQKIRRQHSYCRHYQDGFGTNRVSLFYHQVRQLDTPFCSTFRRRDAELPEENRKERNESTLRQFTRVPVDAKQRADKPTGMVLTLETTIANTMEEV